MVSWTISYSAISVVSYKHCTLTHVVRGSVPLTVLALFQSLGALPCCGSLQTKERSRSSSRKNGNWHRRGWLVLLRARHQRIAATRIRSTWRWTGCCCNKRDGDDVFRRVVPLPRENDDVEGRQGSVVHDTAASEFRQLVARVVESEEDDIFRSIVAYL